MIKPGDVHRLRRGPITTTQLVMYAGASGDFNRIHFDLPFAQQAGLDGLLVHGMLTMGVAASCATEAAGAGGTITDISGRFLAPVKVGDVIDITSTAGEASADGIPLQLEARVGETVVLRGQALVRYA